MYERKYCREVSGEQIETYRCSRENNSDDRGIIPPCRPLLSSFFYLTAATRTPRTHINRRPCSRDRQTDLSTVEDPRRPRFPAANPCRFPRRTRTSGSLCSGSVLRTAILTRCLNFARYKIPFSFYLSFSIYTLRLHLILFGLFSISNMQKLASYEIY